ncbi:MAG TPA: universal stress protein [Kofleriaceae bacterium]|nr:universal stress protein [Kofleriaceae bacterium]
MTASDRRTFSRRLLDEAAPAHNIRRDRGRDVRAGRARSQLGAGERAREIERRAPTEPSHPVLLAWIDGTSAGTLAWREAVTRARRTGGSIIAMRVVAEQISRGDARAELERWIGSAAGEVEIAIAEGDPATAIAATAQARHATMVVIGHDGLRPATRLPLITEAVAQRRGCAVLIARHGLPTGILLAAIDFSDASSRVVATLSAESSIRVGASPILAHVTAGISADDPKRSRAANRLLHAIARCELAAEAIVLDGEASRAIVEAAEDADAEIVIVGLAGHGAGSKVVLGSVAERVIRHARCSVLIVPNY